MQGSSGHCRPAILWKMQMGGFRPKTERLSA
jgi:hypothetical protein